MGTELRGLREYLQIIEAAVAELVLCVAPPSEEGFWEPAQSAACWVQNASSNSTYVGMRQQYCCLLILYAIWLPESYVESSWKASSVWLPAWTDRLGARQAALSARPGAQKHVQFINIRPQQTLLCCAICAAQTHLA